MAKTLDDISESFRDGDYIVSEHAGKRMYQRNISYEFLEDAIGRDAPKIIKRYEYHYQILGWGDVNEPLHAHVAHSSPDREHEIPILITVYKPNEEPGRWRKSYERERLSYILRKRIRKCLSCKSKS